MITTRSDWAKKDHLAEITTMPVWGRGFEDETLQILSRNMIASVTQQKYTAVIELTRNQAAQMTPPSLVDFIQNLQNSPDSGPQPDGGLS